MPILKYKDPADGLWKPVPVGGSAGVVPNEVVVDPVEPVDPAVELWLDVDEPNTNGGLLDQATADDLYVNVTGDAMVGQLGLVAPTLITNAARWADGIPRFATVAERDAAYATIGGPVAGMRCDVEGFSQKYFAGINSWATTLNSNSSALPNQSIAAGSSVQFAQSADSYSHPYWLFTHTESSDYIRAPVSGLYMIRATLCISGSTGGHLQIGVSGTNTYVISSFYSGNIWPYVSGQYYLTAGNYVQVLVQQLSAAITVTEGSLSMTLMNP